MRGPEDRPRLAILGSGRGSNAVALMDAFSSGQLDAALVLVFSNVPGAPILCRAKERGYPTAFCSHTGISRQQHETRLSEVLAEYRVEHLLLAGYMRVLSPEFVRAFRGHILNIHPSLLPDFPGSHAVADQWRAGVKLSGATVHFVDEGVDSGPLLLSGSLVVRGDEGMDGLAERIRSEVEHTLYPRAVQLFLDRLRSGRPLHQYAARGLAPEHQTTGTIPYSALGVNR